MKKDTRLIITQQEMVLIKNSMEARNTEVYGNLYECLGGYSKLTKRDLDKNLIFDKRARAVLVNVKNKKEMMDNINKEWHSISNYDITDTEMYCELCGRKNIVICYIRNRLNDKELHVGSECVKNFTAIDGIQKQLKTVSAKKKDYDRQKRKLEFEEREGEDFGFSQSAEEKFKSFEIMLPFKLYTELKEMLYQINLAKTTYVNSGGNLDEVWEKYLLLKEKINQLFVLADSHCEKYRTFELVCEKEASDWLLNNNRIVWEKVSKNNGMFNLETLKYMYQENYVQKKMHIFKRHLKDRDIKILKTNGANIRFKLKSDRYIYPVEFQMPLKIFMKNIGCYCLIDQKYTFGKNDLTDIAIDITMKNFEAVYNGVASKLKEHGYDFIIEEKTMQAYWKKMPIYGRRNKWSTHTNQVGAMYKKSSINKFLNVMKSYLLRDEKFIETEFDSIRKQMEGGYVWLTQEDKNMNEQIAMEAKGLQRQKEFIPYI